jgi:hypothetical protein
MKLKYLFSVLLICLSAIASFAQTNAPQQPIEISISTENPTFFVNSGAWLAKVKITNRTNKNEYSQTFGGIYFVFEKTPGDSKEEDIPGAYGIEEKTIKPGESFEFEVDLRKLNWQEPPSKDGTYILDSENRSPYQPALLGNYTVHALIPNCQIIRAPGVEKSCIIPYMSCNSNMLAVKVAVKTDK